MKILTDRYGILIWTILLSILIPFEARAIPEKPDTQKEIGVKERLGGVIPADLVFFDESGEKVTLKSLVDRPTIIYLSYYRCSNLCRTVSGSLASIAGGFPPGPDYRILAVSMDDKDTPVDALKKKRDFFAVSGGNIPDDGWRFLVGDKDNIASLASALGISFRKSSDGFDHPAALILLSKSGKIVRYIRGEMFLPAEIRMAIAETAANKTAPTVPRLLKLCYRYDPETRGYVLDALKVSGLGVLFGSAMLFIYLNYSGRKGRRDGE
ncbi:MAG: SCO family protein [Deltaproteobacteria bacterium]|nr:SCO family protein [Deltaproteobacteria bacterium]